jgi:TRAP-type C4-dicarboxylate transport system permease small subunit
MLTFSESEISYAIIIIIIIIIIINVYGRWGFQLPLYLDHDRSSVQRFAS